MTETEPEFVHSLAGIARAEHHLSVARGFLACVWPDPLLAAHHLDAARVAVTEALLDDDRVRHAHELNETDDTALDFGGDPATPNTKP
jgi:hypothetical protein